MCKGDIKPTKEQNISPWSQVALQHKRENPATGDGL